MPIYDIEQAISSRRSDPFDFERAPATRPRHRRPAIASPAPTNPVATRGLKPSPSLAFLRLWIKPTWATSVSRANRSLAVNDSIAGPVQSIRTSASDTTNAVPSRRWIFPGIQVAQLRCEAAVSFSRKADIRARGNPDSGADQIPSSSDGGTWRVFSSPLFDQMKSAAALSSAQYEDDDWRSQAGCSPISTFCPGKSQLRNASR